MISDRIKKLMEGSSVIRAMFEEGKRLKEIYGEDKVFDFSLGNPCLEAPSQVNKSIIDILEKKELPLLHGYMDNSGHSSVRKKIAESLNKEFQTSYQEKQLIMTVGAAGGLNVILSALLNEGDEVITFSPYFPEYRHYVENFGGKLICLPPNEKNQFRPDEKSLSLAITNKTKAVLINNPNNPTGMVYCEREVLALSTVLREKEKELGRPIYLISDEPYRELVYDGLSLPFLPNFYHNTILCYSYSKSLSLAGERIGYLLVPPSVEDGEAILTAAKLSTRILGFVNAPSLIQLAVAESLEVKPDFSIYEENRNILYRELRKMGFSMVKPEGAFYLFLKSPVKAEDFAKKAKEFNLLLVPATAFGVEGYLRLAYCVKTEHIKNSLPAFQKLAEHYKLIPTH